MWLDNLWHCGQLDRCVHLSTARFRMVNLGITGALLIDKVGRKPLMLAGFAGTLSCLVVEAALLASFASPVPVVPNRAALKSCVALL